MACLGLGRTWGQSQSGSAVRLQRGEPLVELVLPPPGHTGGVGPGGSAEPGVILLGKIVGVDRERGGLITQYTPTNEKTGNIQSPDSATLLLPNGIVLKLHQAGVKIVPMGTTGGHRFLITPLPTTTPK
jgi:hypothetical protein